MGATKCIVFVENDDSSELNFKSIGMLSASEIIMISLA